MTAQFIGHHIHWPRHKLSNLPVFCKSLFCGSYSNMLIMSKTCHAPKLMSMLDQIPLTLLHTLKLKAEGLLTTPMVTILDHDGCNKNGTFPELQVYGQQLSVESIGGEETPSASDCIVLHD